MKELPPIQGVNAPYIRDITHAGEIAEKYGVPNDDVLLMSLNLSGVQYNNVENDRGRFWITMPNVKGYRVALTITTPEATSFVHTDGSVQIDGHEIGKASAIEKDTCTDSYWRGDNHLTLNTNQRSLCKGCGFCGTYNLERGDHPLTDEETLQAEAGKLTAEAGDFSHVNTIGIVTGCFMDEKLLVEHIQLVRKVFSQYGFKGEIQYVGSQIRNEKSIAQLAKDGEFSLYLTLEVFSHRDLLMKKQKNSLTLERAKSLLKYARSTGSHSSFLYIAGLDSLKTYYKELPDFAGIIDRFPQIQTYQLYSPKQIKFRHPEAFSLDYFFKMRQFTEKVLPGMSPIIHHNYRGLWYDNYLGKQL